jgi:hypothetical protein
MENRKKNGMLYEPNNIVAWLVPAAFTFQDAK